MFTSIDMSALQTNQIIINCQKSSGHFQKVATDCGMHAS